MTVSQASKNTYADIQFERVTQKQQRDILRVIRHSKKGMTRKEIARELDIDPGSVAGRCNMMMGVVIVAGDDRKCKVSGRVVGTVKLKGAAV